MTLEEYKSKQLERVKLVSFDVYQKIVEGGNHAIISRAFKLFTPLERNKYSRNYHKEYKNSLHSYLREQTSINQERRNIKKNKRKGHARRSRYLSDPCEECKRNLRLCEPCKKLSQKASQWNVKVRKNYVERLSLVKLFVHVIRDNGKTLKHLL